MIATPSTAFQAAPVTTSGPAASTNTAYDDSFANLVEATAASQAAAAPSAAKALTPASGAQNVASDQLAAATTGASGLTAASGAASAVKTSPATASRQAQAAALAAQADLSEAASGEPAAPAQAPSDPAAPSKGAIDASSGGIADDAAANPQKPAKLRTAADASPAAAAMAAVPALTTPQAAAPAAADAQAAPTSSLAQNPAPALTTTAPPSTGLPTAAEASNAAALVAGAAPATPGAPSDVQASLSSAFAANPQSLAGSRRAAPTLELGVAGPVAVRVTASATPASPIGGAATGPTGTADVWRADLAASAASSTAALSDPAPQSNDASPSSLVALLGGAQQAGEAGASSSRGVGAQTPSNTPVGLGGVTPDTATVVGASGSSSGSGSGFQDDDQQSAAKTAQDRVMAAQTAALDGDMPDAVLEAAFGGLLAPAPPLASSVQAPSSADAEVTPDTLSDLASQTAAQAATGVKSFQIVLNPAGLGQVNVSVSIGADGQLSAAFAFDNPEAANALSAQAKELHDALAQSGFHVSTAGLSFTTAGPQTPTAAPTAAAPSLTANLGQGFSQGSPSDQGAGDPGAGSLQSAGQSTRDWSFAASQGAGLAGGTGYGRLQTASGVDVRV